MKQKFETPILFLIFNRPDTTQKVFNRIREIQPKYLYVAADGPRINRPDDKEKCVQTKAIIKTIDWDCEIKTLYRKENLGCGKAVSGGIDWFFSQVEEGIILEDDVLPDLSFFQYCEELLAYHRNNEQILLISGFNPAQNLAKQEYSYYYHLSYIWGWASWRRAWNLYDYEMKDWDNKKAKKEVKKFLNDSQLFKKLFLGFDKTFSGKLNTWDYQFTFAQLLHKKYSIVPANNLVANIGLTHIDATHKNKENIQLIPSAMEFPLIHNPTIEWWDRLSNSFTKENLIIRMKYLKYQLKKVADKW